MVQIHASSLHASVKLNSSYTVYIGTYYEVHDVMKYTQNVLSVITVLIVGWCITNYVTCASGCFV